MGRKRERECGRRDGGVGGWKGNRLVREIEKECEGMWVLWVIEGVQEEKQKREIVQIADRGSWQTGAKTNPAKDSVLWSILSLSLEVSFTWLCKGYRGSRAMGVITALGIIQLNTPYIPPWLSPSPSFLCPPCSLWRWLKRWGGRGRGGPRAVWAGHSMTRSSGWTRRHLAGGRRDCEQSLRECCGGLGLSSWVHTIRKNRAATTPDLKPHTNLETRQTISGS